MCAAGLLYTVTFNLESYYQKLMVEKVRRVRLLNNFRDKFSNIQFYVFQIFLKVANKYTNLAKKYPVPAKNTQ